MQTYTNVFGRLTCYAEVGGASRCCLHFLLRGCQCPLITDAVAPPYWLLHTLKSVAKQPVQQPAVTTCKNPVTASFLASSAGSRPLHATIKCHAASKGLARSASLYCLSVCMQAVVKPESTQQLAAAVKQFSEAARQTGKSLKIRTSRT